MPAGPNFDSHRNKIFREGWSAFMDDVLESACPYKHQGSPERRFWLLGWSSAAMDFSRKSEPIIDAESDPDTTS